MPDIITTQIFADAEKGITATKMNNIIANSTIQTDFIANKPAGSALNPTDQLLELTSGGTYARITGAQLASSVSGQLTLANSSQSGMLHQTSGNFGDYCGGDNLFHVLNTFVSLTAATTLTSADTNKLLICSGGSWTLTLPAAANGLAHRLRNDMGISGTTGTITVTPPTGTIDGVATLKLLPQQECTILCDGTNWRTFGLKREVILGTQDITSSTANSIVLLPVGYRYFELEFDNFLPTTNPDYLQGQLSNNGGSSFPAAGCYHGVLYNPSATTASFTLLENVNSFYVLPNNSGGAGNLPGTGRLIIFPSIASSYPTWRIDSWGRTGASLDNKMNGAGVCNAFFGPVNAFKYLCAAGNILNCQLTVKGVV